MELKEISGVRSYPFLQGGGEMGELTRSFDWSQTPIGNPDEWPQSLRIMVYVVLSSKYPMFLWWGEDLIQFYNDAYRPSLGIDGKHPVALGQKGKDCWPEIWPVIEPLIQTVLAGGATWSEDQLIPIYRNGHIEDVYWTFGYSPVLDDDGRINGVLVVCNETTDKILTRKKLEESERNFRNMILQSVVAMCIFRGPSFIVEIANKPILELWEKTAEEVIGKPIFESVPEAKGQGFEQLLENVYTSGETFSAFGFPVHLLRNGVIKEAYINFVYQAIREADGSVSGIMVVASDVTKEIETLHRIELMEERARLAIEASGIGTYDVDLITGDLVTSHRYNEIFGFSQTMNSVDYLALFHPDDLEIRDKAYQSAYLTGKLFYECRIIKKDKTLRWIKAEGNIIRNTAGMPARIIGTVMDVTETKYLLKQKDDFVGIASHELKTPVTTIKAYVQLLENMLKKRGDIPEVPLISKVDKQVSRLTGLINDLLDSTKMISGRLEFNDINLEFNSLVSEVMSDFKLTTDKEILIELSPNDCVVHADKDKIEQIILNLVNNAIKFSPGSGKIIVRTLNKNNEALFEVKDFGIGIKEETKENIFQQFYRANDGGKHTFPGLGLGLYISSEIIKREGGKIWVESIEGSGSTFTFSLPCIADN